MLESNYPDFPGLNLTAETLNCLRKHETPWEDESATPPHGSSLEAQIVNLADEISYYAHDIDDGLRAELITFDALERLALGQEVLKLIKERYPKLGRDHRAYRPQFVRSLIHVLITDIVAATNRRIAVSKIATVNDVYALNKSVADYSEPIQEATDALRQYLYANFYLTDEVQKYTQIGRAHS